MKKSITRRDFLKLAGAFPLSLAVPRTFDRFSLQGSPQNVIIVVFDALSAENMLTHGYARETMPNLNRLAERAVVYYNHYSGGNFTVPGTASLLTGTLPWAHRAFNRAGKVEDTFIEKNIFSEFKGYYRLAYTHNEWANTLLHQFKGSLDYHIPLELYLLNHEKLIPTLFGNDADIATIGWNRAMRSKDNRYAYSLFLSRLYEKYDLKKDEQLSELRKVYPWGIPNNGFFHFLLEQAIDSIGPLLAKTQEPFLGYFHFFPPHDPYNTHKDFARFFKNDGYSPVVKPLNPFSDGRDNSYLANMRNDYDEFILYADREFARFYQYLESSGLLENTWLVLTADHGELFERGIIGHITPVLYRPLIHIPLVIFEPGRKMRTDVYSRTSAIDLLPTLLQVTGQQPSGWTEGYCLEPFASKRQPNDRSIYSMEAARNGKWDPLKTVTVALIKDIYKLIYYSGYEELAGDERIELYDLEGDPEELEDLSATKKGTASELLNEVKAKLEEVNKPYE